jgi:hypothetical protein
MRIEDVKARMEWKKDTAKPHPWFSFKRPKEAKNG